MPNLLTEKTVLLAKIETTSGSDITPDATNNAIEIFELSGPKPVFNKVTRNPLKTSLSPRPIRKSKMLWEASFKTELKNGGTAGTAGKLSPLFRACGWSETVNAGTSVVYKPGTPSETCTIYIYKDGLLFKMIGAAGTFKITGEAGGLAMIEWTFRSKYTLPIDATIPASPTYETTIAEVLESCAMQINSYSAVIRNFEFDAANNTAERPSLNAAGAIEGIRIANRNPAGKVLMEAELRATKDYWADWDADTLVSFAATIGATAGNIVAFSATSKVQFDEFNPADENGIFMIDASLIFSGTDDEFTITLT